MPDRLDQCAPRPVPPLAGVEGEDLALLPVLPRHVREHAEQSPPGGLDDKRRMIQRAGQFSQAGHPETVVAGKKLLGRSLIGGVPRTDLHRINVTAMKQGAIALLGVTQDDRGGGDERWSRAASTPSLIIRRRVGWPIRTVANGVRECLPASQNTTAVHSINPGHGQTAATRRTSQKELAD
jgi:hypothetical protein